MGVLEGFDATWSNARSTFGQGAPQGGDQFDDSGPLRELQDTVKSAKPDNAWTGPAADAYGPLNERQARVLGQMAELDQKLRAEVDRSAQNVAAGRQNLDAVRQWVKDAAAAVPPGQHRDRMLYPIVSRGAADIADILQRTNGDSNAIAQRMSRLVGEYQALAGDVKKAGGPDGQDPDPTAGAKEDEELKKRAQADVKAALDGDKGAISRVQAVLNTVNKGQLGGQPKLNPEQAAYLSQMQAQQKLRSVEQLTEAANKGAKGIMADSWQLMSNPKLEFPKTESVDGALQSDEVIKGGFDRLPDSVQSTIQSPGIERTGELQQIADIVNGGNEHFQTDTDLDRGLMHKVADMMESPEWRSDDPPIDVPGQWPWEDAPRPPHAELERVAMSVFNAVDGDHQVLHDALTGNVEPGNEFREQFKVNSQNLMYNITHEAWDDGGAAAGALFDWTNVAPDSPEAKIAAETANAYATYIGDHRPDLLSIDSDTGVGVYGTHTLGDINPALVQAMSHGLVPYVDEMGGMGDSPFFGEIDSPTERDSGLMPTAKGVFAVLNSDELAATTINSAAYQEALKHETAFAMNPGDPDAGSHLHAAATMRGLVDVGAHEMFQAKDANGYTMDKTEYEWKKMGYDAGVNTLKTAGSVLVPGVGPVSGIMIDKIAAGMAGQIIGESPSPPVTHGLPDMTTTRSAEYVLNAMLAAGQPVNLPPGFITYDDPAYPDGKVVHPPNVADRIYYEALKDEVGNHIAPVTDGIGPLEDYTNRYNNVTQDPDMPPPPNQGG
ncbi:hypothetical protein H7J88_16310 [Mycolicibacterium flavescens]|uniref:Uncharacterized protein n=1 Tax=Mycolicibacterium flavescens TaxID=1776 RepID=A0A1E3RN33_MYCFV|nr:EspA/EspE family type VII secretion system effector [Mycolicibacterium flavescens]MCV7281205.1 hypothetical protein [Mycolicibacterium flavescens]ODQ91264.1 hypothetical protein BHQ18_07775 [Mycolicibacterium flavescens]